MTEKYTHIIEMPLSQEEHIKSMRQMFSPDEIMFLGGTLCMELKRIQISEKITSAAKEALVEHCGNLIAKVCYVMSPEMMQTLQKVMGDMNITMETIDGGKLEEQVHQILANSGIKTCQGMDGMG